MKAVLDSGAYTAFTKGVKIDIERYIEFNKKYEGVFEGGSVNLDVIGNAEKSYKNWKILQRAGVHTIPVYHLGTEEKWLLKYMEQTDYIAIGAIANLHTKARLLGLDHVWKTHLLDAEGKPKLKVHGLGLTAFDVVSRYPWYSVDSAIAVKTAAFGGVVVPKLSYTKKNGKIEYQYNHLAIDKFIVSSWRASGGSSINNYHYLPPIIKEGYAQYFKDKGYEIGDVTETTKQLRRKDKRLIKQLEEAGEKVNKYSPLIPRKKIEGTPKLTLMEDWMERYRLNLDFWVDFREATPTPLVYHVLSGTGHVEPLRDRKLPFLVSYFLLMNEGSLFKAIMNRG